MGQSTLRIVRSFVDFNSGCWQCFDLPQMEHVRYITIHNTAEPFSSLQERMRVQNRIDGLHTCFHFVVDEDIALQILPVDRVSYHAGDGIDGPGNTSSISIEISRSACYGENSDLYYRAEENAFHLCAYLMQAYSIPVERVRKHQDWSGKFCPHRMIHENRWEYFLSRLGRPDMVRKEYSNATECLREEPIVALCHGGNTTWMNFRGRSFNSIDEVIVNLKARATTDILVSAWHDVAVARSYLKCFEASQICVKGYYAVAEYDAYWARENILQAHRDFEHYILRKG